MAERMKDLAHLRATKAASCAQAWPHGRVHKIKKHVQGMPILVRSMGAAQAISLLSSGEARELGMDLAWWLTSGCPSRPMGEGAKEGISGFIGAFVDLDQDSAHAVDEEALRFAEALKLFATAVHG